jgi:hypothetical protein
MNGPFVHYLNKEEDLNYTDHTVHTQNILWYNRYVVNEVKKSIHFVCIHYLEKKPCTFVML